MKWMVKDECIVNNSAITGAVADTVASYGVGIVVNPLILRVDANVSAVSVTTSVTLVVQHWLAGVWTDLKTLVLWG